MNANSTTRRGLWPHAGEVYTTSQIINSMILPDSPCFNLVWNGRDHPVQLAHMSDEALKKWCELAGDYKWRFLRVTREDVPVFLYVDSRLPIYIFDAERMIYSGSSTKHDGALWITPVGFPRKQ